VVKIQAVFWVLMLCSVAERYQHFRVSCHLNLNTEDEGSKVLWNVGILWHRYMVL
jgi:hypothetical protein